LKAVRYLSRNRNAEVLVAGAAVTDGVGDGADKIFEKERTMK
jgi:hypothetical protein